MKKRICAALVFVVLFLYFSNKQEIVRSIYKCQQEDFREAAQQVLEQGNAVGVSCPKGVTEVSYWADHSPVVDFFLGDWGLGSETSYWGIHYVPSGEVVGYQGTRMEYWRPEGKGTLFYEVEGDNTCYVEPLGENWYYYEAHF